MPILIFNWKIISLINIWTILICLEPQPKLEASIDKKNKIIISLTGIAVIQLSVFEWVYNISALFFVEITGVFVIILGFFIRAWALNILQGNFSKEITTFKGHKIVAEGPFKLIRHPTYLGAILLFIGTALFLGSILSAIIASILIPVVYNRRISKEEEFLNKHFPKAYDQISSKTWKLIPYIY